MSLESNMIFMNGLRSLKDMGGRRRLRDRRKIIPEPLEDGVKERRVVADRRSGFDRRGIANCHIRPQFERRAAFKNLLQQSPPGS